MNMNRILTTLLFAGLALAAFSQDDEENANSIFREFYDGEVAYLMADSVNVRETADIKGKMLDRLPIGTKITIVEQSEWSLNLNGFSAPWYLVEYGTKKKGYVWGGKIAFTSFRSSGNTDYVIHFGPEKYEDGQMTYQLRVEKNHKELQRISVKGFGNPDKEHTCTNYGDRGLTTVDDVIYITGDAQYCADAGGSVVLFFSGGKLIEAKRLMVGADAPMFWSDELIFPADMEGKKDVILFHEEVGEVGDDNELHYETNQTTKWKWDGKSLVTTR
jgi:hypothetical protein